MNCYSAHNPERTKVTFDVFGVYTHGHLAGKTNPKSVVSVSMWGRDVGHACGKLTSQTNGATFKITGVEEAHGRSLGARQ